MVVAAFIWIAARECWHGRRGNEEKKLKAAIK
jgi:hypothetical protein